MEIDFTGQIRESKEKDVLYSIENFLKNILLI